MRYTFSIVIPLVVYYATAASLPEAADRRENTIVLEVAPKVVPREGKSDLDDDPFEIVVPIARNFSSLDELFQILREDSSEPRVATGTPPSYVKGSERNASEFLIFFTDGVGKRGST